MDIFIEELQDSDMEELLAFELENRAFFEEMVPSRGDDYYTPAHFNESHKALLDEQTRGASFFYLIKDKHHSILGRINVVDIEENQRIGHLGYRVGQIYTGRGIANRALQLLLKKIVDKDIKQIHAKTTTTNIPSQKVLEKNGFKKVATSEEGFEMNGQNLHFVYYTLTTMLSGTN
ncbi:GNAT family N-acetyltransferase [Peribacillus sp. NPDC046944]|uniref:GNAT family N-acetyltransferase n=1 Tax=unclassified Peribacillus TaxID=2675266 RepID=UPI003D08229A